MKITPEQVEKRSWFCHDALLSLSFWQPIHFGGTLSLLVCGVCFALVRWPSLQQNLLFLSILDATFDIEDHSNAGRKTVSAVSLFRRQPFREGFWVRSRGFAGRDTQTQPKVQTVHLQAKSWCELSPKAAKPPFFKDSGRDVWHWRSLQRRSKNGVIELARPCCFPVPEAAFLGRLLGQKSWFCRSWYPNATEGANGVFRRQLEVQIASQSCKTSFFYRFWTRRLTLKITPTQVEKRCPWARQAMLFPCSGGSLFGKAFGSEVVVLPVVTPKRNGRCKRCISKAIGGANCAPQLQKPPFFLGSGRDVWHWRSLQRRSKNGVIELARPCCFPVPEAAFLGRLLGQKSWFCRSWYPNATEGANGASPSQIEVRNEPQSCKTSFFL